MVLPQEVRSRTDQLYHMAAVMYEAARTEDHCLQHNSERLSQLEYENKYLRELLSLSSTPQHSSSTVTGSALCADEDTTTTSDSRSSTPRIATDQLQ